MQRCGDDGSVRATLGYLDEAHPDVLVALTDRSQALAATTELARWKNLGLGLKHRRKC
jgi:hypothetical protein